MGKKKNKKKDAEKKEKLRAKKEAKLNKKQTKKQKKDVLAQAEVLKKLLDATDVDSLRTQISRCDEVQKDLTTIENQLKLEENNIST